MNNMNSAPSSIPNSLTSSPRSIGRVAMTASRVVTRMAPCFDAGQQLSMTSWLSTLSKMSNHFAANRVSRGTCILLFHCLTRFLKPIQNQYHIFLVCLRVCVRQFESIESHATKALLYGIFGIRRYTTPLLSNVLSMLKPGGWLQWEEMRADFLIEPSVPDLKKSACETLAQILKVGAESRGLRFGFLAELDQHLTKHSFEDVSMFETVNRKQDYKGWAEDFFMVWEEIAAYFPSKAAQSQAPMTREFWAETFSKAIEETERGVALHQGAPITVVGRKPRSTPSTRADRHLDPANPTSRMSEKALNDSALHSCTRGHFYHLWPDMQFGQAIGTAALTFAITNIDDAFVL
ncbi:hypothetical protein F5B22DRAFT_652921 [Xylaria bambusicola]|uniref:uncharacterized protein n=1 Tax=Xylaria bambusicola TaxID=326684 RepID=UPI002007BDAA|nr:uncharacterized protein F5B22DRAFT_652921 [Xylaria bambusicola]KAI0527763.1 hypothetical protein F5B22DRAFT_652921 [Xylaria bambusicola]